MAKVWTATSSHISLMLTVVYFASVSCSNDERCLDHVARSSFPKKPSRLAQSRVIGLSARLVLRAAAPCLSSLLLPVFRVLARRIRCRPGMGSYETEQEEMDCQGGPEPRLAQRRIASCSQGLDSQATSVQDGQRLFVRCKFLLR